jgi:hypothetical protein
MGGQNTELQLTSGQATGVTGEHPVGSTAIVLSVQPSVVTHGLVMRATKPAGSPASLRVTDRVGRCVARFDVSAAASSSAIAWGCVGPDGARLAAGRYFVRLETGSSRVVRAFTVR